MTHREYLFHLEWHGIKLGLENIRHLLDAAGAPEKCYPVVHVAGTNGKGSVVAFLDAIVRAAGYRVGRFTSPHLLDVTERFLVDGTPMPEAAIEEEIGFFRDVAEHMDPAPTFFEMNTAIAFRWFERCKVDFGIIEVGMGGRLDSTNVVDPIATAITNIALDHMAYLGDTLEKIAFEKAGIIKPGVPLVLTEPASPAQDVILARAAQLHSPVYVLGIDFRFELTGPPFAQIFTYESAGLRLDAMPLSLAGVHQGSNAASAVALAERIMLTLPRIDAAAIRTGLSSARWPCRLEKVLDQPPVIIDVAHNPAGAKQIAKALNQCVTLLAVSSDKDASGIIEALSPATGVFILSQYSGRRSLPVADLRRAAGDHPYLAIPSLSEAIALGLGLASASTPLLITGSIFTAGEAREHLVDRCGARPMAF